MIALVMWVWVHILKKNQWFQPIVTTFKKYIIVLVGPLYFLLPNGKPVYLTTETEKNSADQFQMRTLWEEKKNPLLEIRKSWQNSFLFQLCNTCTSLWNSKKKVSIKFVFYYFAQMHFDVFYLGSSRNQKV